MKKNYPAWLEDAIFYEVYPQSFYDTDGDGIGDIQGIIAKLDYIKSLGVTAIWINPWYESPYHDAGYDVSDYYQVDARYGTNEDARQLFDEASRRGLRILLGYSLYQPNVDRLITAVRKREWVEQNIISLTRGSLQPDELAWLGIETEKA